MVLVIFHNIQSIFWLKRLFGVTPKMLSDTLMKFAVNKEDERVNASKWI